MKVQKIADVIYEWDDHGLDRDRLYNGQPHTDQGERGKTLVSGLTFRDVCDCFVAGWLHASGRSSMVETGAATYNDIYGDPPPGFENVDPLAVMQNMSCEMERRMGIFPNVPGLEKA